MTVWKRDFSERTFQRFAAKNFTSSYSYEEISPIVLSSWENEMYEKRLADRGWVLDPKPDAIRPDDV